LVNVGSASVSGTNTIDTSAASGATSLTPGTYTLISAAGGISGSGSFTLGNSIITVNGITYGLSLATNGGQLNLTVAVVPAFYWDPTGGTGANMGGSGTWSPTAAVWSISSQGGGTLHPLPSSEDAVFSGAAGTVTVSGTVGANSITFATSGYTLQGGGTISLLGSPTAIDVQTGSATINLVLGGSSGLALTGPGTLTLGAANTYTGDTSLSGGGTLVLAGPQALPLDQDALNNNYVAQPSGNVTINGRGGTIQYTSAANNGWGEPLSYVDLSDQLFDSTAPVVIDYNGQNIGFYNPIDASNTADMTIINSGDPNAVMTLSPSNNATNAFAGGLTIGNGGHMTTVQITNPHDDYDPQDNNNQGTTTETDLGPSGAEVTLNNGCLFVSNNGNGNGGGGECHVAIDGSRLITAASGGAYFAASDNGNNGTMFFVPAKITGPGPVGVIYSDPVSWGAMNDVVILTNPENSYQGDTQIGVLPAGVNNPGWGSSYDNLRNAGATLQVGAEDVIPHGSSAGNAIVGYTNGTYYSFFDPGDGTNHYTVCTSVLDLNGYNTTVNGLSTNLTGLSLVDPGGGYHAIVDGGLRTSGNCTLTVGDNNASSTFNGIIGNGGNYNGHTGADVNNNVHLSLTKIGTGTLTLGGPNTYNGSTTVSAGSLVVSGSLGNTAVSVANGATLGGAGSIGGTVSLAGGGIVAPGNTSGTAGTLSTGALQIGNATTPSVLNYDLANVTTVGGGINDLIAVNGNLNLAATTLNINALDGAMVYSGTYKLITYTGTLSGSVSGWTIGSYNGSGNYTYTFSTATSGEIDLIVQDPPGGNGKLTKVNYDPHLLAADNSSGVPVGGAFQAPWGQNVASPASTAAGNASTLALAKAHDLALQIDGFNRSADGSAAWLGDLVGLHANRHSRTIQKTSPAGVVDQVHAMSYGCPGQPSFGVAAGRTARQ
jgi:autotransporter-associated beta strand protein